MLKMKQTRKFLAASDINQIQIQIQICDTDRAAP